MSTNLLDTNVIIDAINEKKGRNRLLINLVEQQGHTLACCPINVSEVYAGMRPKEEPRTTASRASSFTPSPSRWPRWPGC